MKNKKIIKNTDARKRRNNENFKTELSVCSSNLQYTGRRYSIV